MKYFKAYEVVDRRTYEKMGEEALSLFDPEALQALDDLREFFGVPIKVNDWKAGGDFQWRGYRTKEKAISLGAPNSMHAQGKAFDCDVRGMNAWDARNKILSNKDSPLLIRITRMEAGVNWVHFDLKKLPVGVNRIYLFSTYKGTQ